MQYGKYEFVCTFESDAVLPPFKGSTFRGVFGHALKHVVCALKYQTCDTCLLRTQCVYPLIFETPSVRTPRDQRITHTVPHPFVIEPPESTRTDYPKGAEFRFHLILIGEFNAHLPYFIYAMDRMGVLGVGRKINGERGRFVLEQVLFKGREIYARETGTLTMTDPLEEATVSAPPEKNGDIRRMTVTLKTPLRFKDDGKLSADLHFPVFARLLLRRAFSLIHCYDSENAELPDSATLMELAETVKTVSQNTRWRAWERFSQKQQVRMNMDGVTGTVVYEGELGPFLPLARFGEILHVGKQTTFGLGGIGVVVKNSRDTDPVQSAINLESHLSNGSK